MQKHRQIARILVVEDDKDTAEAMKVALESEGYVVRVTGDPVDGVSRASMELPDLIILDVMFGDRQHTKGFDIAVKMKVLKDTARIPILMVSAVNARNPTHKFRPETDGEYLPVDDFIDKPAQPEELLGKVKELLAQGESRWVDWPDKSRPESPR